MLPYTILIPLVFGMKILVMALFFIFTDIFILFHLFQEFTELVVLCKPCRVLFWQSYGHPCMLQDQRSVLWIEYTIFAASCSGSPPMVIPACSKTRGQFSRSNSRSLPRPVLAVLRSSLHAPRPEVSSLD
jgi:hypothetical protein